jgi:hypothetical protein
MLFSSYADAFRKRALEKNILWAYIFFLLWSIWSFFVVVLFVVLWKIDSTAFHNLLFLLFIIFAVIISVWKASLGQWIYKNDKISVILPYTNLNKIFIIFISFLILWDWNIKSFLITLVAVIVIILFSVDFKNKMIPTNLLKITIFQLLVAFQSLLIWKTILMYNATTSYSIQTILTILLTIIIIIIYFRWNIPKMKWMWIDFYKNRIIASFLWSVSTVISYILIKSYWLVLSTLFSFLWIIITLIVGYFMLNDVPKKKDIVLSIIICLLVWLWYYFK